MRTVIEPFRITVVDPIRLTTRRESGTIARQGYFAYVANRYSRIASDSNIAVPVFGSTR